MDLPDRNPTLVRWEQPPQAATVKLRSWRCGAVAQVGAVLGEVRRRGMARVIDVLMPGMMGFCAPVRFGWPHGPAFRRPELPGMSR